MFHLNPEHLHLAEEFKLKPFGPHSRELERLLLRMRQAPVQGRPILISAERHKSWRLARLTGRRGDKIEYVSDKLYHNVADAEWDVFVERWKQLTGCDLEVEAPDYSVIDLPTRR